MNSHQFMIASFASGVVLLTACSQPAERVDSRVDAGPPIADSELRLVPAETPALGGESDQNLAVIDRAEPARAAEERSRTDMHQLAEQRQKQVRRQARIASGAALASFHPAMTAPMSVDRERYAEVDRNGVTRVAEQPVSTFSLDVDTGSYSNVRRFLSSGRLPPRDAVRVEEMINYFDYAHAGPKDRSQPFSLSSEIAPTPWNDKTLLLQIGVQAWQPSTPPPASNLVFLVDVSGSMHSRDKLPLVKTALKLLSQGMSAHDRISLVVYAGASGVVLEPTAGDDTAQIGAALERLRAGGSTNGGSGIQLAYAMARQAYIEGGVNRVILATDGDFNVGVTRFESLLDLVRQQRESGIALTTLGFGQGNYNDHLMEQLADAGNGNHAYIDTAAEAHKVLVRQRNATLMTVARDVKVQIEFNPQQVAEYRLIGYENRLLAREDFANDKVDAGEIGAGHSITALYEIALKGSGGERIRPLRYGTGQSEHAGGDEIAHLRLRYKPMDVAVQNSRLIERPLFKSQVLDSVDASSESFRMAAAVSAFGQLLAGDVNLQRFDYTEVAALSDRIGKDPHGNRAGFRQLVQLAERLSKDRSRGQAKIGG